MLQWALAATTSIAGGRYKGRRTWLQVAVAINRAPPCCKEAGETNQTGGEAICEQRCRCDKHDSSVLLPARQRFCKLGANGCYLVREGQGRRTSLFIFRFVLAWEG
jgi:hypothetical protein